MSIKNASVHHFADDTNLLYSNKSLKIIGSRINKDLRGLTDWLNANHISLNVSKTEFLIFRSPNKITDFDIKIKLNGKRIFPSSSIKYLGVTFDETLSWKHHVTSLSKKLNRANSMLAKIRHYVNSQTLRSIYFSIFSSHLTYGSQIWGQKNNSSLKKIITLQKCAVRIITFSPFRSHTTTLFRDLIILKFQDHTYVNNCLFVFDHFHNHLPVSLSSLFLKTSDIHHHATRNNDNQKLHVPSINTSKYGINSIKHQCILNWNSSLNRSKLLFNNTLNNTTTVRNMTRNQYKKILYKSFFTSYEVPQ